MQETNCFEQLLINYANEKLQQHFLDDIIEGERGVYLREGIAYEEFKVPKHLQCSVCDFFIFKLLLLLSISDLELVFICFIMSPRLFP